MTSVKICGLTRPDDVLAVNALRPDMAGFVFHRPSRRYVGDSVRSLSEMLEPGILPVGVFVDSPVEEIGALVDSGSVGAVQLHGSEDSAFIRRLRMRVDVPVIQAFIIGPGTDLELVRASEADMILLDAGMGSGNTFDWSLVSDIGRDFILSGGLDPGNVAEAMKRVRPSGVDVSSGVETDGRKDPRKMSSFMERVRQADHSLKR